MPKAKKGKKAGQKAKEKANQQKEKKVKIDKTFGMKNKGGRKNAQYVENYRKSQEQGQKNRMSKRKRREKEFHEANLLGAYVGKVGGVKKGHDNKPKKESKESEAEAKVKVCQFFARGQCRRGNKCKFSHDLALLKKATEEDNLINVYEDKRDKAMEDMTQEELEDLVRSKQTNRSTTDIICKFFLEALEKSQYGHRWKCPNGDECIYRHKLPLGYVIRARNQKNDDDYEDTSLEEGLEQMRQALRHRTDLTPVTPESFAAWKETWIRRADEEKAKAERKAAKARGSHKQLSGRQLFTFDPTIFQTSDDNTDLTKMLEKYKNKEHAEDKTKEPEEKKEKEEEEVKPAVPAGIDASLFEDDLDFEEEIPLPESEPARETPKKRKKKKKKNKKEKKKVDNIIPSGGEESSNASKPVKQRVKVSDPSVFKAESPDTYPDFETNV